MVPPTLRQVPVALLLVLTIAAVFGQAIFHGFVYDDFALFSGDLFRPPYTRPLTLLTFRFDLAVGGVTAHAFNLFLHVAASLLVFGALRRVIGVSAAQAAAVIFALHPIQAEAVNYVWARSTLLMTVFCLLSLNNWLKGSHWWAAGWFALALLSKEECVAFPLFLLLLCLSARRAIPVRPIAAMLAMSVAAGTWIWLAASATPGSQAGTQSLFSSVEYLSAQGFAILRYLWLLVMPVGLTPEPVIPLPQWWAWGAVILVVVISLRWFRNFAAGLWILAAIVLLLPSSSVFPANDLSADRRMYLPMVALAAAAGLAPLVQRKSVLAGVGAVLAVLSFLQSRVWIAESTLWAHVLEHNPASVRARIHLVRSGDRPALPTLLEAKKIAPDDALVASELGRVYLESKQIPDALSEFGRALALEPSNAQAMANRGVALLMLGQREAARSDFERALRTDPCTSSARHNLRQMGYDPEPPPFWCEGR